MQEVTYLIASDKCVYLWHKKVITYNSDICSRLADIVHCIGCFTGLCPLDCKKVRSINIVCTETKMYTCAH